MKTPNIPFVKMRYFFVGLSMLALILSASLMMTKGLNFGIDFKGGFKLQYHFKEEVSEDKLRTVLSSSEFGNYSIQSIGKPEELRFTLKFEEQEGEGVEALSKRVHQRLAESVSAENLTLEKEESVGPKAGKELRRKGQLALIISWVLILIYIGYRFDFYFAPGAIVALIHDVTITMGAFALTGREVSLTTVAALLAIIGYSINDTIIIYDRVRENIAKHIRMPTKELINLSINETLSRTLITSLTALFVVVILFLFGEGEIQGFGFAMTIGVVAGTYSTIFVATPVYIFLKRFIPQITKNNN